jgi:hypothetical protein
MQCFRSEEVFAADTRAHPTCAKYHGCPIRNKLWPSFKELRLPDLIETST